jgi:phage gp36-like protein
MIMDYCTVQDVRNALVDPYAPTPTNTAADQSDDAIQDAVSEASAIVDSYLDGPYDPTTDTIPTVIKYWTRDIAAYYATLTWRKSLGPGANDPIVLRYDQVLGLLKSVVAGQLPIAMPGATADQPITANRYDGVLMTTDMFDLTGRSYPEGRGWPLWYYQGWLWYPTDLPQAY